MDIKKMIGVQKLMLAGSTDHERTVAKEIFQKILNKEGLTEEQFNGMIEQKEIRFFSYKNKHEKKLLLHVIGKTLNKVNITTYKRRAVKKMGVELSKRQFVELMNMYDTYKEAFEREIGILLSAFIFRNDIYPDGEEESETIQPIPDSEEIARNQKIISIANSLGKINIRKRIKATE